MFLFTLFFIVGVNCVFDHDLHKKFTDLPLAEFVEHFNKQNISWTAHTYEGVDGFYLGQEHDQEAYDSLEVINHDTRYNKNLPKEFDARKKWNKCSSISKVPEQGECNSCWMFATANTITDRICIKSGKTVEISEADLECCTDCYTDTLCKIGGNTVKAFNFWKDKGLVTTSCKSYHIENFVDRICHEKCEKVLMNYEKDKNYGLKAYTVSNDTEENIMTELVKNGPISASFVAYEDVKMYHQGIYEHKFGERLGRHAVRLIGYGVEDNTPYWLAVNSWGETFGLNGLFKVKKYDKDLEFESHLVTGYPKNLN